MAQIIALDDYQEEQDTITPDQELLAWVNDRVTRWRDHRDAEYKEKWEEYYRIWRGVWSESDKMRGSERSKLISPATQQAVEATVAEFEEATFGRGTWFDISDDVLDKNKSDIPALRVILREDMEKAGVKVALREVFLNAALYGAGIGEIIIDEKNEIVPVDLPIPGTNAKQRGTIQKPYKCISLNPVSPFNFCIDTSAVSIDTALGCAIEEVVSKHLVVASQKSGIYKEAELGGFSDVGIVRMTDELDDQGDDDKVKICKYYGMAPRQLIKDFKEGVVYADLGLDTDTSVDKDDLVESIIVIANDSVILKAEESPYMMQDRPVIAYAHDKVPGRFWGRGVVEKGFNIQKALDAELRARIDALALTTHPMMAADATRLPRGFKPKVTPGNTILTQGNPAQILMPFHFGNLDGNTFRQAADLERMITMATGAMDTAAPTGVNARNNTLGGMSLMQGAMIKRQKRSLANFNEVFLVPLVEKFAWRYMQFDPQRYPIMDYKFIPTSTMGLMAREYETQQLIQLMNTVPKESPAYMILLNSVYENSSLPNREEIMASLQKMMQPDPQSQQLQQMQMQLTMQKATKDIEYIDAQIKQLLGTLQIKAGELQLKAQESNKPLPSDTSANVEIDNRAKIADLALREKELNMREAEMQHKMSLDVYDRELAPKQQAERQAKNESDASEKQAIMEAIQHIGLGLNMLAEKVNGLETNMNKPKTISMKRDKNGNLVEVNGQKVQYDKDGNMTGLGE